MSRIRSKRNEDCAGVLASTLPLTYETGVSNLSFTCTC